MAVVDLWDVPPLDVRASLTDERERLLRLLGSLSPGEWLAATGVPGWSVKDVALHLLDDDLGWLSRGRDGDSSGRLQPNGEDPASFVLALAEKNQRWIDGASGLSRAVVSGMLEWAGAEMDAYYASLDLLGEGHVSWASAGPVPTWFDIAQDLTERWVHQMQVREALGRVEDYRDEFLPTVLGTFVWALPHQFVAPAPEGTTLEIDLSSGGVWHLRRSPGDGWDLAGGRAVEPQAKAWFSDDAGWRWLTGAEVPVDGTTFAGPASLGEALMRVRGILV